MKKLLMVMGCLAGAWIVSAAQNDVLITFSTPGTDTYADGTTVLDGERYALVWTKDGETFGGLTAAARPVKSTDVVALFAPVAKGGKCPVTAFQIDATYAQRYDGGTFALYLLDTRVRNASGAVTLAESVDGVPATVNAVGRTAVTGVGNANLASGTGSALDAATPVALGSVGVYTEVAAPQITALRVDNATVTLTVQGMSPVADYFVVPGSSPNDFKPVLDAAPKGDTFTFDKPAGATFFKVIGARKFQ